jgi:hypothetical protein
MGLAFNCLVIFEGACGGTILPQVQFRPTEWLANFQSFTRLREENKK